MEVIDRSTWGAKYPIKTPALKKPLDEVVIHTMAAVYNGNSLEQGSAYLRAVEGFHVSVRNFTSIAYNYAVDPQGRVYIGRGHHVGAHTQKGRNLTAWGVSLFGHGDYQAATDAQIQAIRDLIAWGQSEGLLKPNTGLDISGHREYAKKSCPGTLIYPLVQNNTFYPAVTSPPQPIPVPPPSVPSDPMSYEDACYVVFNLYWELFARNPEQSGFDYWVNEFVKSKSGALARMLNMPEVIKSDLDWLALFNVQVANNLFDVEKTGARFTTGEMNRLDVMAQTKIGRTIKYNSSVMPGVVGEALSMDEILTGIANALMNGRQ